MEYPNTYISIHSIERLTAEPGITLGAPIALRLTTAKGSTLVNIFMKSADPDYTQRMIDAINGAAIEVSKSDPAHEAAHAAAQHMYKGSER